MIARSGASLVVPLALLLAACAGKQPAPGAPTAAAALGSGNPASSGLDRHDALYCGEWQLTNPGETMYWVKGGKVVWSHAIDDKDELGDCHMTSNGHVIFSRKSLGAQEIVPDLATGTGGQVVWEYLEDPETEVHTAQPVGLDKVFIVQNGTPAKALLIDKKAARTCRSTDPCVEKLWTPESHGGTHGMFRHARMLANGNLLIPYTGGNQHRVVEYDQDMKPIWELSAQSPWAAVRLKNGNTLISGNHNLYVREVSPDKKVVWELTQQDLPEIPLFTVQEATRLANGNTLVNNWCGGKKLPKAEWAAKCVQVFEVTPDKKVVWKVQQWDNPNLGPGSSTQLLDEPGVPEKPGDIQR